ncbi:glucuronosyltransferase [Caenorhabditis elegans]|uniref:glucuronosyltransferase n=1 Tax=Caenorhabditis elegans TaxID=6239 RepID=O17401_CAEEL|nr:glucuronosyltransferase [Caenorhabditis elegans]CCD64426.1 glucuronosyltransferase [Caenorhabditis elegans]|eukprot:NP_504820.2 UDP-GlucuronosylTransferase [Caenorhabditis elegans]
MINVETNMKLLFCLFFALCSDSYNFLVFCPLFGHSHTTFFAKIADTLTYAGHNVTFFTPTIVRKFSKIQYVKSITHVLQLDPSDRLVKLGSMFEEKDVSKFWYRDSSLSEMLPMIDTFNNMFVEQAAVISRNLHVLDDLKEMNFDVMIFEHFVEPAYLVLDYLEIQKFIPATSLAFDYNMVKSIGEPLMLSTVPLPTSEYSDRMSLPQRLINAINPLIFDNLIPKNKYRSYRPPYAPINTKSIEPFCSAVFTNSNPYIDYPRATLEKNVQVGGISVDIDKLKSQKVSNEWDAVLNLRPKTVLVSFGSIMLSKDMPINNKITIATVLGKFPDVTFIWKYETNDTSFANGTENIHFSNWVPQTALLADPRLSAFFTHAGLGSVNEVSYLGKPTIMCPIFADQMRNAKMLARHNGSIEISKYDLSNGDKIEEALSKILFDESYKTAAEKLAHQLANQPVKPKELLVRHAEFAAQFGHLPSLDPHSRQMSFIQYFLIDLTAIILSTVILFLFVLFKLGKLMYSKLPFNLSLVKQKTN